MKITEGEVEEGVQIAQMLEPLIKDAVSGLLALFQKHAPAATPEQLATATTQAVIPVLNAVTAAGGIDTSSATAQAIANVVQKAVANPPSAPAPTGGVHFAGSVPTLVK